MHILLITPAPPKSRAGNRATATRWRNILCSLGHRVDIATEYHGQKADLMLALHAWRSADAIKLFATKFPAKPLIVAITGTDAYRFMHSHRATTLQSIKLAHSLVGLHELIANTLPANQRQKMHVIYQSAQSVGERNLYKRMFHISVLGHLRDEKDPLRPALAARLLPDASRIQVHQFGKACDSTWREQALKEMAVNARYHWHEEVPHYRVRQILQRTHVLVLPSRMEGGANVISEAVVAGVPIICSDIEGSIGLLGTDYPGYYAVGDEQALAEILLKAETDDAFYQQLKLASERRRHLFTLEHETQGWRDLLASLQ